MSSATAHQPFIFTPSANPGGGGDASGVVSETRREIAAIVREVAIAVRSDLSKEDFLGLLVDRILRAMAAEGVVVWRRTDSSNGSGYHCARRLGRTTDQSIPCESIATHLRLITEIAADGNPVVVPPTPGATDSEIPYNPTGVPAALVPIECDSSLAGADYLLEVFLEPEAGVATQRGYLRFVAQMADLAAEFFRADQLRSFLRRQTLASQVDEASATMHQIHDSRKLAALIVDGAAECFGFDRVGLCSLELKRRLLAVSHVNTIDQKSPAADQIRGLAKAQLDDDGCSWFEPESPSANESVSNKAMIARVVVGTKRDGRFRLVCLQASESQPIAVECRGELVRFMQHAELALQNASRVQWIPGGRLLDAFVPSPWRQASGRWRSVVMSSLAGMLLFSAAFCPIPLVVDAPATIRAAEVQTLCAPRDAVVEQIHVRHGQQVAAGDKLLTMVDPALEEQITALVGRRAVLLQQQSRWTEALVDTSSNRFDRMEQVQGERSLVAEEIQSVDEQLAVLQRVEKSLDIRADRDGFVDAWQIGSRLQSRPLKRGDELLQVVSVHSPWIVEARVPQTRIAHLQQASEQRNWTVQVAPNAEPERIYEASIEQFGPAVVAKQDAVATTAVLLRLHGNAGGQSSGAPARVMFHCGKSPAGYVLFQDMIRLVRGNLGLYLGHAELERGDDQ